MELYKNLTEKELSKLEVVKDLIIDENSFKIAEGICPECSKKMDKVIENKSLFNGAVTFHIIKYKCGKCSNEYLDLEQAEKLDLFLIFKKLSKMPLPSITQSMHQLTA